jgi:hypothetical protein
MPMQTPIGLATFTCVITRLRHRTPIVAAVMAFGLLAAACGSDTDTAATEPPTASQPDSTTAAENTVAAPTSPDGTTPAPTSAAGDVTTATPVAVPEALQFTAPLVGGGEFTGADVAGKPTVFWFWAPT